MMSSNEIRQYFLDFFTQKNHVIVPSASIVIKDDPTLLFTNAGMNQFKDYFLGNKIPTYKRVADTQKCLRVSGKHNDLEEVGVDTYHHTMFEMLGNWSFGDYFKKEAIAWSWELLTEVFKIPRESLYVTVFEGDEKENLPRDEEAISYWEKIVGEERIIMGNKKDNFWEMGDTGPCGPCTEIHVDCRNQEERNRVDGKYLVNKDDPQVIEIWNNVFIEYNRKKNGSLEPLPAKHVDTGMGFERLVRIIQNKESNYDTDVFTGTISEIENLSGKRYTGTGSKQDVAFRVIADHIRAIAFTIADGQMPSNTGAGYVIRRILRRAVRYYFTYLNYKTPLLFQLMPVIAKQFENVFPEVQAQVAFITKVVKEEEEGFLRTLGNGLKRMAGITDSLLTNVPQSGTIKGEEAFELFDTYGFPLDLTKLIASENNMAVDIEGFEKEMQQQKNRSRAAGIVDTEEWNIVNENGSPKFVGYDSFETESTVLKYRKTKSQGKESYQVVLDKTPFYAEGGGQVGDKGSLVFQGEEVEVTDTKKENDLIIHFTHKLPKEISSRVTAKIDEVKRSATQVHHSATHLMHAALRIVLGKHVAQKGSLVNEEHLRFDFSHFAKVTDEELAMIESLVNKKVRENIPVVIKVMPREEAMRTGAMALFGEKYGETVRVVIIDPSYSIELCGGTHVAYTGELGIFKIKQESAVGAGLRRIEAVSGKAAEDYINGQLKSLNIIREALKSPKDINKAIENLLEDNGALRKQADKFEASYTSSLKEDLLEKVEKINGINFIGQIAEVDNPDLLRKICFSLKPGLADLLVVLAANINGKAHVAIMIDDTLASENLDAAKIIKQYVAPLIKGGGGGQKTFATAGGSVTGNLATVIERVRQLL